MTNIELFDILSKTWASVNDIKLIASCGRDEASFIRNCIMSEIMKNGSHLPATKEKIVPMESVIKFLDLNIDYIASMAQKEKLIKS
jgi:hypothetical protein